MVVARSIDEGTEMIPLAVSGMLTTLLGVALGCGVLELMIRAIARSLPAQGLPASLEEPDREEDEGN
ncbi:MAG TPA: hypothetical protein VKM94_22625 [Blastocatellia bacterium]|nr:hypothetical protein [Blastocatellia bacterium]